MNIPVARLGELFLEIIKENTKAHPYLGPVVEEIVDLKKTNISDEAIRNNLKARAESMLEDIMREFKKEEPVVDNPIRDYFIEAATTLQEAGATDEEIRALLIYKGTLLFDTALAMANSL